MHVTRKVKACLAIHELMSGFSLEGKAFKKQHKTLISKAFS